MTRMRRSSSRSTKRLWAPYWSPRPKKDVAAIFPGDDPDELLRSLQDRFAKAHFIGADAGYEGLVGTANTAASSGDYYSLGPMPLMFSVRLTNDLGECRACFREGARRIVNERKRLDVAQVLRPFHFDERIARKQRIN